MRLRYVRNRNKQEGEYIVNLLRSNQNQLLVCANMKLLSLPTIALFIQYHISNIHKWSVWYVMSGWNSSGDRWGEIWVQEIRQRGGERDRVCWRIKKEKRAAVPWCCSWVMETPPGGSSANSSEAGSLLVSWCSKNLVLHSRQTILPRHEGPAAVTQWEREWAQMWRCRGVSLIQQCAASLRQSAAMIQWIPVLTHTSPTQTASKSLVRSVTLQYLTRRSRRSSAFNHLLSAFVWCRALILQCSLTLHYNQLPLSGCNES